MAKAQEYLTEYETQLAEFNKLVEDYNKKVDQFDAFETLPFEVAYDPSRNYFYPKDFKGTHKNTRVTSKGQAYVDALASAGLITNTDFTRREINFTIPEGSDWFYNDVSVSRGGLIRYGNLVRPGGPDPGDFTAEAPTFDMEKYKELLQSDFETESATNKEQFELARKAEEEKYAEQKAELEEEQAILAEENAKALAEAEKLRVAAEEAATSAQQERERRTKQFKDETETLQRTAGAQRSAFVRARRLRGRPLLGN